MTKTSDKSADTQSEARISVAYNKNCHLSLMTSFVKRPPDVTGACAGSKEPSTAGETQPFCPGIYLRCFLYSEIKKPTDMS